MTARSVYAKSVCLHCHHVVQPGRAFVGSTFYVQSYGRELRDEPQRGSVTTFSRMRSRWPLAVSLGTVNYSSGHEASRPFESEVEVRVVYHRTCLEKILALAPMDPEQEKSLFDAYREELVAKYSEVEDATVRS